MLGGAPGHDEAKGVYERGSGCGALPELLKYGVAAAALRRRNTAAWGREVVRGVGKSEEGVAGFL